jgi:pantothenate kinase-related protein Tda10
MQFSYRYINRKKITRKIDYIMSFKLINKIYDDIIALKNDEKPLFIGVDGSTAAGKTFLAKNLKKKLLKVSKPVWICELE